LRETIDRALAFRILLSSRESRLTVHLEPIEPSPSSIPAACRGRPVTDGFPHLTALRHVDPVGVANADRNFGLDVLRATAIMLVLTSHYSSSFNGLVDTTAVGQVAGFLSVELFFVLSGFLIGKILLRTVLLSANFATVRRFWMRRWLRTLPAYYAVITLLFVLSAAGAISPAFDPRFLSFYAFVQNFFSRDVWEGFFGVGWSLVIEEWFYFLFPLLLLVARRVTRAQDEMVVFACCTLMIFGPLVLRLGLALTTNVDWWTIRKSIIPRFDSIGFGLLIAALATYRSNMIKSIQGHSWFYTAVSLIGIAGLAVALRSGPSISESLTMKTLGFVVAPICFALMLPVFVAQSRPTNRWVTNMVTFVSVTSYSIYLVHWDIFVVLKLNFDQLKWSSSLMRALLALAATFLVAWLLQKFIEQYFMKLRDKRFPQR
jgi:peptidoglycan/LPS O-acetylase OafA/YrhL